MFDFALSEFFLLALIALIFLGPKELMILFKTLGTWMGKFKSLQRAFYHNIQSAMEHDAPSSLSHNKEDRDDA